MSNKIFDNSMSKYLVVNGRRRDKTKTRNIKKELTKHFKKNKPVSPSIKKFMKDKGWVYNERTQRVVPRSNFVSKSGELRTSALRASLVVEDIFVKEADNVTVEYTFNQDIEDERYFVWGSGFLGKHKKLGSPYTKLIIIYGNSPDDIVNRRHINFNGKVNASIQREFYLDKGSDPTEALDFKFSYVKVILTKMKGLTESKMKHLFRDNDDGFCLFNPIEEWFYQRFNENGLKKEDVDFLAFTKGERAKKTQMKKEKCSWGKDYLKKFITNFKNINKMKQKYKNGVPEEENAIQEICDKLRIGINIHLPYGRIKVISKNHLRANGKKDNLHVFNYIIARANHLELCMNMNSNKKYIREKELIQLENDLKEQKINFFSKRNRDDNQIVWIQDPRDNIKYQLKFDKSREVFDRVQKDYNFKSWKCQDGTLKSDFIIDSIHFNGFLDFNNPFTSANPSQELINKTVHIDMLKAYYFYHKCKYYKGLVSKVARAVQYNPPKTYKQVKDIAGFYLITDLDFSKCICKKLLKKMNIFHNNTIYPLTDLRGLNANGVKFKVLAGAEGMYMDMKYGEEMLTKDENGVAFYQKFYGENIGYKPEEELTLSVNNEDEAKDLSSRIPDNILVKLQDKFKFICKKAKYFHNCSAFSSLLSVVRWEVIEQLKKIPYGNIIRVRTDGIYYLKTPITILPTFRDVVTKRGKNACVFDPLINQYNSYTYYDEDEKKIKYIYREQDSYNRFGKNDFKLLPVVEKGTPEYDFAETILYSGAGGSGKTYYIDEQIKKGIYKKVKYLAHTWELANDNLDNFENVGCYQFLLNCSLDTEKLRNETIRKWEKRIGYNNDVLFFNEVSTYTLDTIKHIIKICKYFHQPIIFAGDIQGQEQPIYCEFKSGKEFRPSTRIKLFKKVIEFTENYRFQGEHKKNMKDIRDIYIEDWDHTGLISKKTPKMLEFLLKKGYNFLDDFPDDITTNDTIICFTNKSKDFLLQDIKFIDDKKKWVKKTMNKDNNQKVIQKKKPVGNCWKEYKAHTIYSVQGKTYKEGRIFIHLDITRVTTLYTALSRAIEKEQVFLVYNKK